MSDGLPAVVEERIVEVDCPAGRVRGLDHDTTLEFRGMPFARAERLGEPVDVNSWTGVHDGLGFAPQAPQVGGALEAMLGADDVTMDEDCLALNVWTPACDGAGRPVLVWIHGGAYVTGSGSMPWYDGNALAARGDVVVVSINYRLGALGFLGHRNLGIADMVAALRWVERNIGAFGGDPGAVTLFGESAGGSAVLALLATPSAGRRFRRVWAMSPSILQYRTREEAAELEATYLDLLGVDAADDLGGVALDALLDAQQSMPPAAGFKHFAPTTGTDTIPGPILRAAADDDREVVVGTTRDEMLLFTAFDPTRRDWSDDDVQREFARRFDDPDTAIERYRTHRPDADPSGLVSAMQTDEVFRAPARRLAERRADGGRSTWVYEFHQTSAAWGGRLGACHGLDLPFAFHNLTRRGAEMFTGGGDQLVAVADRFADAIIAFAHTGDPGWETYDTSTRPTMIIGPDAAVVDDPEPALRELWPSGSDR